MSLWKNFTIYELTKKFQLTHLYNIVTLSYHCVFRTALKTLVQDSQYKLDTVQKEIEGKYKAHFVPIDI